MVGLEKLIVEMFIGKMKVEVGELVKANRKIYFKYSPSFLEKKLEISPFKMRLTPEILSGNSEPFDGLFGVFNDSLPDGWGQLLLDRTLSSRGIELSQITPLDRLAYVGSEGMGALLYKPALNQEFNEHKKIELDDIATQMNQLLEGESTDVIEELYKLAGSSGGARPKINIAYNKTTNHLIHGIEKLPQGYEHWIIKFPSSSDFLDIANIEYAYYKMALEAGVKMSECRLFEGKSGKVYFGTKRFDRVDDQRLHMHSASGLLHDNYRLSSMDYGHLMDCAFQLEGHVGAYSKVLRLAAFNVFAHNRDDHSKNFAFLMSKEGVWEMAPAYDLTFSYSSHGHHSTMVAGESKSPGRKHLLELAKVFGVKKPESILDEVKNSVTKWKVVARECGVSAGSIGRVYKLIVALNAS